MLFDNKSIKFNKVILNTTNKEKRILFSKDKRVIIFA